MTSPQSSVPSLQSGKRHLPKHVGFIMDGSPQWATEQNLPALKGYYRGAEVLKDIAEMAFKNDVKYVSAFLFSIDGWRLPKSEVSYIMKLIIRFLEQSADSFAEKDIRILHVGGREGLPKPVVAALDKAVRQTKDNKGGTLALCINYGGQQEIVDAAKKMLRFRPDPQRLSVLEFEKYLYEPDVPPVDLVVRTAGKYQTDGFMLWRAAMAQYVFVDKYWPDFSKQDLRAVLLYYVKQHTK